MVPSKLRSQWVSDGGGGCKFNSPLEHWPVYPSKRSIFLAVIERSDCLNLRPLANCEVGAGFSRGGPCRPALFWIVRFPGTPNYPISGKTDQIRPPKRLASKCAGTTRPARFPRNFSCSLERKPVSQWSGQSFF